MSWFFYDAFAGFVGLVFQFCLLLFYFFLDLDLNFPDPALSLDMTVLVFFL